LKLGYVSGDNRSHAVSYFIEQVFRHHDRDRVELFAYSTCRTSDATTARLRSHARHWLQVAGMSDAEVRERVAADGIDVLVSLSGHTLLNRMGVFALRAAPVQVEYLGGLGASGLTEMDYWLGDPIVMPAETDAYFNEQVWRLPRVWVSYDGKAEAPLPQPRADPDGAVWLGSFANLNKLTPETLALWARLLQAVPEGRLLLKTKGLADAGNRQRILAILAAHGATADRVELQDSSVTPDWAGHMGYYHRLDIALDPVDVHTGATTTCDALWMGVPVITRLGDRMGFRMTATTLNALGHAQWIARSDEEYLEKAVALARDAEQRRALRRKLRDEMARSPLCDARDLAKTLEDAYVAMYERWLAAQGSRKP
jgi:predicted O-linked N-acetylglucosamine transferase (SPINDLY family)